jgi:NAD(P)-dependent dehydrogenase (short-subunit alcohol dehydrogenase family)
VPTEGAPHDLFRLDGKAAIVTGGGRGIGQWIAQGLAAAGARVLICSRNIDACRAAADEIDAQGGTAIARSCDITDPAQVQAVVDAALHELDGLDILVNNSGATWGAKPEDMPLDRFRQVLDVNVTGTFLASQLAARAMIERGQGGAMVNIASVAGLVGGRPEMVQAAGYAASKGAVISLTRNLATSWAGHGIRVNAIAPGWFPTKMSHAIIERHTEGLLRDTPLARFGAPDDIKGVALFLASPASAFMTGQVVVVDGGASVW